MHPDDRVERPLGEKQAKPWRSRDHLFAINQLLGLGLALFIEQIVFRGIEGFQQICRFQQAGHADVVRARPIERGDVGEQFGMDD